MFIRVEWGEAGLLSDLLPGESRTGGRALGRMKKAAQLMISVRLE